MQRVNTAARPCLKLVLGGRIHRRKGEGPVTQRRLYALLVTTIAALSTLLVCYNWFARPDVPLPVAMYLSPAEPGSEQQPEQTPAEHEQRIQEVLQSYSINLNTADAETLTQLPRIGQVLAGRIIEYRNQHGPFDLVDQLLEIKGIGEVTLEALRPYVYIQ